MFLYYNTMVMPLNYDSEQLYDVLSDQCLLAADQIMVLLDRQDPELYDYSFKVLSEKLKPVVMADHEVGLEGRKNIISGMVQRTGLVDRAANQSAQFLEFLHTKASSDLAATLISAADGEDVWEHINKFVYDRTKVDSHVLCGNWMQGYNIYKAVRMASELHHHIVMYSIGQEYSKTERKPFASHIRADQRKTLLLERLQETNLGTLDAQKTVEVLFNHPNFMEISSYLFSADRFNFQSHAEQKSRILSTRDTISPEDTQCIEEWSTELNALWTDFHVLQTHMTIHNWASHIAQRSWTMLNDMKQGPVNLEQHVFVDATSFSKSLEQRREVSNTSAATIKNS